MIIRGRNFDFNNKIYIMGILNATPDSFSDGGNYFDSSIAIQHGLDMVGDGADIVDIGGESTRPGFEPVDEEEELRRVIPVIKGIRQKSDVVISIDTTKAKVAREAIAAGADIINDVSGFLLDEKMCDVACETGAISILMHDGIYFEDSSAHASSNKDYALKVREELEYIVNRAIGNGVSKEKIIIDPGVGFGKSLEENLIIVRKLGEFSGEYPILLGCSRKSIVGKTLDLPIDQRLEGTLATHIVGVSNGASIIRVHDVKEHVRAIRMYEAIMGVDSVNGCSDL